MAKPSELQIIGAGYCRTGTMSTKTALDKLGYNTHHMFEVMKNMETQGPLWLDVVAGKPDWDKIFENYSASVDCPSFWWYKELSQKYPDAKIVLTVRDPEKWYQSCYNTIYQLYKCSTLICDADDLNQTHKLITTLANEVIWGPTGCFQGRFKDKEWTINQFKQHIEEVKRTIPADKLLVFEVKEGWEPLCKFLGKPVPDEPFPHVNDTNEMKERLKQRLTNLSPEMREEFKDCI
ncbi:hypothetical protein K7432_009162 [Basidiobolus ranarum]|uniref:Sulfotransferase family protein n=1 Tax=Basidiobolus ranarum TaxID=34480 RepID=A0ABR2VXI0_9FUNG